MWPTKSCFCLSNCLAHLVAAEIAHVAQVVALVLDRDRLLAQLLERADDHAEQHVEEHDVDDDEEGHVVDVAEDHAHEVRVGEALARYRVVRSGFRLQALLLAHEPDQRQEALPDGHADVLAVVVVGLVEPKRLGGEVVQEVRHDEHDAAQEHEQQQEVLLLRVDRVKDGPHRLVAAGQLDQQEGEEEEDVLRAEDAEHDEDDEHPG